MGESLDLPFRWRRHRLDNGLRLVTVPTPGSGLVALHSVVRTGSRDEVEPGRSGFAHLFEHMMFRGTDRHPAEDYDRMMAAIGADANAYTTEDWTCYHVSCAAGDLPVVVELESDRFQNLSYDENAFRTEAGAVSGEYHGCRTDPEFVLEESLRRVAFRHHPYGHTVLGLEADIAAMPELYEHSREFYDRHYRAENTILMVVGDCDDQQTADLIEERYGDWPAGYREVEVPAEPEQSAPRETATDFDGRTLPLVAVAWRSPVVDPNDPATVAGTLLGEQLFGRSSRVYCSLVLERRLVQDLKLDFGLSRDPGLWLVTAAVKDVAFIELVTNEIVQAADEAVGSSIDERRLSELEAHFRYRFLMGLDHPDRIADRLAPFAAITGSVEAVLGYHATIAALESDDLRRAAARFLDPARRSIAVVTGSEP